MEENKESQFKDDYSEDNFWGKLKKYAKIAGKEVIEKALTLYYAMKDSETPIWAKSVIVGTLGYFIMPLDAIADPIPAIGYADDLGILAAALATVAVYIKPEHKESAKEKLKQWFGD